jgi:hypothetical protein
LANEIQNNFTHTLKEIQEVLNNNRFGFVDAVYAQRSNRAWFYRIKRKENILDSSAGQEQNGRTNS